MLHAGSRRKPCLVLAPRFFTNAWAGILSGVAAVPALVGGMASLASICTCSRAEAAGDVK